MKHEPRVYRFAGNPHFIGSFYAWDAAAQSWRRVRRSTECANEKQAMGICAEWQRLAHEAAGGAVTTLTRERVLASVNFILRLAGLPEVVETQTWASYSAAWLQLHDKGPEDRTAEAYRSHVKTFTTFLGPRAKWPLSKFDGALAQAFYDSLVDAGRSPKTAKNISKTLARVFERAREEGFCARNPIRLVVRRTGEDVERPREVFTVAEQEKVLAWLGARQSDASMRDWLTMTWLGIATGRRLQDCANAGWQNFEEVKSEKGKGKGDLLVWTLRPAKLRRLGKVERVPILGAAATYLRALRKQADGLLLCPMLAGRRAKLSGEYIGILKAAGVSVGKVEALGAAGNEWQTKGFHSWRHTLTSRLAEAGVDQRLGKRITGHASDKVHEGYTHLEVTALAEAMRRVVG